MPWDIPAKDALLFKKLIERSRFLPITVVIVLLVMFLSKNDRLQRRGGEGSSSYSLNSH
jgi:hypothetical protein